MPVRDNFHSEEAQEIMGKVPSWVVRWGITVIFLVFVGILIGCYFIKYPETVEAPIVITTVNPPSELVARSEGLISRIYVADGQRVGKGELIAAISNPADHASIDTIYRMLKDSERVATGELVYQDWIDNEYGIGELQGGYSDFRNRCLDYRNYLDIGYTDAKTKLLSAQIAKNREYYAKLKAQQGILREDMGYMERNIRRDSMLFARGVISSSEYETSQRAMLDKRNAVEGFNASLVNTELNIIQTEQQLIELSLQRANEVANHERGISQARQQMLAQIGQWQLNYLITSPIDGMVALNNYWSDNQRVRAGDVMATVVPEGEMAVTGRMHIPSAGMGKVKQGQTVNVKLNGYPYMEFGILKGRIEGVAAVPDGQNGYLADVRFPDNLTTSYGRELSLIQQMDGIAEIITEDRRLIERFIQPVKAIFKAR